MVKQATKTVLMYKNDDQVQQPLWCDDEAAADI